MKKLNRMIALSILAVLILAVLVIMGSFLPTSVFAGPPWPAEVYVEDDICATPWLDKDYNLITIYGDGIWKLHEFNNSVTLSCHNQLNFDEVATIEEVCGLVPEFCNGQGTLSFQPDCYIYYDYVTYDSHFVINPSGRWTLTCHFNENDLP